MKKKKESQKDLDRIKEIGKALPRTIKHPSGKFRIIISDAIRENFGELYLAEEKKREKNERYKNKNNV